MSARPPVLFLTALALAAPVILAAPTEQSAEERLALVAGTRPVDVVVVLDTSGSMEDLLDATRARIWDVINTLGKLMPTPELRVGLVSFGTERSTAEEGWIVIDSNLTNDLDDVYGKLMALSTAGGEEFVGRALHEAIDKMDWSRGADALKIIFVAGNESADQAASEYDFRTAALWARGDGIFINALYAGNRDQGIVEHWPEVAREGRGSFAAIDPEKSTIQIPTPQDEPLLALNRSLNGTYLPYGPDGANGLANQVAQDSNASRLGVESCSSRIVAKGSALYTNAAWDLVDATSKQVIDVATMHQDDLPEEMSSMSAEQREAYVEEKRVARETIQDEIQELSVARESYIKNVIAKERLARGLDAAMKNALVKQAVAKGFECDGC